MDVYEPVPANQTNDTCALFNVEVVLKTRGFVLNVVKSFNIVLVSLIVSVFAQ